MKNRGFDTQEIAEKLHEKGIEVKPPTLAKYRNEFRRGKGKKKDTPPPPAQTVKIAPASKPDRPATVSSGDSSSRRIYLWTNCSAVLAPINTKAALGKPGAVFVIDKFIKINNL